MRAPSLPLGVRRCCFRLQRAHSGRRSRTCPRRWLGMREAGQACTRHQSLARLREPAQIFAGARCQAWSQVQAQPDPLLPAMPHEQAEIQCLGLRVRRTKPCAAMSANTASVSAVSARACHASFASLKHRFSNELGYGLWSAQSLPALNLIARPRRRSAWRGGGARSSVRVI